MYLEGRGAAEAGVGTYSIGQLASLTGLPIKTIRFYSDEGILPPAGRTESGHRRYSQADLARLQLARSLRELDVDLPTIRRVLSGHDDLAHILAAHVATVEARIRALQRQRAVLRAASRSPSQATVRRVQALARLDATERRRLLDHFWDRVLDPRVETEIAARFREHGSPELPADPTPEQLDAWLELAELVADEDFQRTTRRNATWVLDELDAADTTHAADASGERAGQEATARAARAAGASDRAMALAAAARAAGSSPSDTDAEEAVAAFTHEWAALFKKEDTPAFRRWLLAQLDTHTDPRAARYWELVGIIAAAPPEASAAAREHAATYAWLIDALRARSAG